MRIKNIYWLAVAMLFTFALGTSIAAQTDVARATDPDGFVWWKFILLTLLIGGIFSIWKFFSNRRRDARIAIEAQRRRSREAARAEDRARATVANNVRMRRMDRDYNKRERINKEAASFGYSNGYYSNMDSPLVTASEIIEELQQDRLNDDSGLIDHEVQRVPFENVERDTYAETAFQADEKSYSGGGAGGDWTPQEVSSSYVPSTPSYEPSPSSSYESSSSSYDSGSSSSSDSGSSSGGSDW